MRRSIILTKGGRYWVYQYLFAKSDAFESIHGSAQALCKVGAISKTMLREFDVACLAKLPSLTAAQIRLIRERNHVSQPDFARMLNISESTVQKWEAGVKHPSGIALKMLTVVEKLGLKSLA